MRLFLQAVCLFVCLFCNTVFWFCKHPGLTMGTMYILQRDSESLLSAPLTFRVRNCIFLLIHICLYEILKKIKRKTKYSIGKQWRCISVCLLFFLFCFNFFLFQVSFRRKICILVIKTEVKSKWQDKKKRIIIQDIH